MSYCRFGEGDVYVYESILGTFVCDRCKLEAGGFMYESKSRSGMIAHLEEHIEAGHDVPAGAIERLRAEIETEGDVWKWVEDE